MNKQQSKDYELDATLKILWLSIPLFIAFSIAIAPWNIAVCMSITYTASTTILIYMIGFIIYYLQD